MDSRDLIVLGLVGVGGWLAYRWWKNKPTANQAQQPKSQVAANAASSMTEAAARASVFGGATMVNRILPPSAVTWQGMPIARSTLGTATPPPNTTHPDPDMVPDPIVRTMVMQAVLGPLPVAPSPNNNRFSDPNGAPAVGATAPVGSPPQPGDPAATFTNVYNVRRAIL